jgi:hypothetical protein
MVAKRTYQDSDPLMRGPHRIVERFLAKVDGTLFGCWYWTGKIDRNGYSGFWDGKAVVGHKWAWEHVNGPTPAGLELDHLCRNRACVNPLHLEPVTRSVNILRGDSHIAAQMQQTHCIHGHAFTPENTIRRANGGRKCRTCASATSARYAARKRARLSGSIAGETETT